MLKKIIAVCLIGGVALATDIKDDTIFVGASVGSLKIHDSSSTYGVKAGYYFYNPNVYKINNRVYVDFEDVDSSADFYITSLKFDWIKNTSTPFAPFVGLNVGYLYFSQDGDNYSTGVWGGQLGVLCQLTSNITADLEASYQKAYTNTEIWSTALKTMKIGVEYNF